MIMSRAVGWKLTDDEVVYKLIEFQQPDFQHVQLTVKHEGVVDLRLLFGLWEAVLFAEILSHLVELFCCPCWRSQSCKSEHAVTSCVAFMLHVILRRVCALSDTVETIPQQLKTTSGSCSSL